jgi:death on curing protein
MNPVYLNLEDVLALHRDQIAHYSGSPGVRDLGLLLSAIELPKVAFAGRSEREDLYEMSAAYMFLIVQSHPFVDANKRAGLAATIAFLRFNGLEVAADHDALTNMVLEAEHWPPEEA